MKEGRKEGRKESLGTKKSFPYMSATITKPTWTN
jgi:hypothetical protein